VQDGVKREDRDGDVVRRQLRVRGQGPGARRRHPRRRHRLRSIRHDEPDLPGARNGGIALLRDRLRLPIGRVIDRDLHAHRIHIREQRGCRLSRGRVVGGSRNGVGSAMEPCPYESAGGQEDGECRCERRRSTPGPCARPLRRRSDVVRGNREHRRFLFVAHRGRARRQRGAHPILDLHRPTPV
jgi:hypothetical protein